MKRPARPEEIAPAFVFLAAPSCSSYITDEILPIIGRYGAASRRLSSILAKRAPQTVSKPTIKGEFTQAISSATAFASVKPTENGRQSRTIQGSYGPSCRRCSSLRWASSGATLAAKSRTRPARGTEARNAGGDRDGEVQPQE
jgi:hypothetical protein